MKKYELIFILDEAKFSDGGKDFMENLKTWIEEAEGKVLELQDMGCRQMAHLINKKSTGLYWNLIFDLPESKVIELKDKYRLNSAVLRLEIFIYDRPAGSEEESVENETVANESV